MEEAAKGEDKLKGPEEEGSERNERRKENKLGNKKPV
jgi:hypothetical protein